MRDANRVAVRKALGDVRRAAATRLPLPRSSTGGTRSRTRSTAATDADHRDRDAALPYRLRPAAQRRVGPGASRPPGGDDRRSSTPTTGSAGLGERRRAARPRAARVVPRRPRPVPDGARARARGDGRLSRRPAMDGRGGRLGRARQGDGTAGVEAARRPLGALCSPTPRAPSWSSPAERAARCVALRDAGVRAVKIRFHHADWREDVASVEGRARCGRHATSRSWSTRTRAGACPATSNRAGTSRRPRRCARALEPLGVYWLEEPLRTDDLDGYAALRRLTSLRLAAGEMVRSAQEARDLVLRGRHRRAPVATSSSSLGIGGCRRAAALADLAGRAWSPHTWSNGYGLLVNLHAALAFSTVPVRRGAVRPAGLVGGAARLAAAGPDRDRRRRNDRAAGGPGLRRRRPISRRSSSGGSPDEDPRGRAARARPAARRSRRSSSTHRRRGRCSSGSLPAGVCHSDVHLADGALGAEPLADGARPRGRRDRRGGRRAASRTSPRAIRSASRSSRPAAPAAACRAGRFNLCAPAGENGLPGNADGRDVAASPAGRDGAPARPDDRVLRGVHGRRRPRRRAAARRRCRCGRRRCSGAA